MFFIPRRAIARLSLNEYAVAYLSRAYLPGSFIPRPLKKLQRRPSAPLVDLFNRPFVVRYWLRDFFSCLAALFSFKVFVGAFFFSFLASCVFIPISSVRVAQMPRLHGRRKVPLIQKVARLNCELMVTTTYFIPWCNVTTLRDGRPEERRPPQNQASEARRLLDGFHAFDVVIHHREPIAFVRRVGAGIKHHAR